MKLILDIELDYTNPNDAEIPFIWYNLLDKFLYQRLLLLRNQKKVDEFNNKYN